MSSPPLTMKLSSLLSLSLPSAPSVAITRGSGAFTQEAAVSAAKRSCVALAGILRCHGGLRFGDLLIGNCRMLKAQQQ
ncbi:hypothetical protein PF002_g9896 [Phytophthora fragariae]|uniref:Secreted protein n=1 Tax=Phytophthora fragariae TaxID=53985 RepID=A0A6A3F7Z0_9STRA|nr:hypothetical protein PF009_g10263 [Phytophthora fragariae]KAE9151716.1 hypothetical protein PF006_g3999 [Phytophthora fragariae]KAE9238640.1 hypothetical protein PF004_g8244 [Phytophthora fragariae]KAE9240167.1 hypothetical protein PF002_g9896 [Phytophthora fragariae]KAE9326799.1 hypothetical protein PF001_g2246 [Phytophthora fragariae]